MFERIGIIGAGAMGRGIAQLFASAGKQVWLYDARGESVAEALHAFPVAAMRLAEYEHRAALFDAPDP